MQANTFCTGMRHMRISTRHALDRGQNHHDAAHAFLNVIWALKYNKRKFLCMSCRRPLIGTEGGENKNSGMRDRSITKPRAWDITEKRRKERMNEGIIMNDILRPDTCFIDLVSCVLPSLCFWHCTFALQKGQKIPTAEGRRPLACTDH